MDFNPINDFFSNIKDKLTNPFFGTLILVWFSRNWELIYSIFNFDKTFKLACKVSFIQNYFSSKDLCNEIFVNISLSILFLILGYILIIATRTISIFVEHTVMPYITKKTINKNIVLKTEYDKVVIERDLYFSKYENERNGIRILSDNYDNLQKNYSEIVKSFDKISNEYDNLNKRNNELSKDNEIKNKKISNLKSEIVFKNNEIEIKNIKKDRSICLDFDNNSEQIIYNIIEGNKDYQNFIMSSLKNENKLSKILPKNLSSYKKHFVNFIHLIESDDYLEKNTDEYFKLNNNGIKLLVYTNTILNFNKKNKSE